MTWVHAFHIVFYVCALLICGTCFFYTLFRKRVQRLQNKLYILMLSIVTLNSVCDIIAAVAENYSLVSNSAFLVVGISNFLYFTVHALLAPSLLFYVCCVNGMYTRLSIRRRIIYLLPCFVTIFFTLTNPLMHWVYYYDENRAFQRNWAEMFFYVVAAVYLVGSVVYLLWFWNAITRRRRIALTGAFVIVISSVMLQLLFIDVKSELLGEAMGLLFLLLIVENEDDRLDADTNTYNRKGFLLDIRNFIMTKQTFHVFVINVVNVDIVRRLTGSSSIQTLARLVATYFRTLVPPYQIYHTSYSTFALLYTGDKKGADALAKKLEQRFNESWSCLDISIMLNAVILYASVPDELKTPDEILLMLDSPFPKSSAGKVLHGSSLNYLIRRADVERALHTGIAEHRFEVYYQPIYRMEDLSLHGAEALLRLKDPDLGFIPPDEFIPVAEQIGVIDEIGDFVLHEVCQFLQSGIPQEKGMSCIHVNLSVIQCMQPGFTERILSLIDSYGLSHSLINFEITETLAASDYQTLAGVVSTLQAEGFHFSMDDYGTGFSNMQSIFELSFDVIKIDKSILWGAEAGSTGKAILENSARMIRQIGKQIVVEGVETEAQIEMLKRIGVDYLQGYYFSKPIPREMLISFLS